MLVSGTVNVHGWALDLDGVDRVRVLIDGVFRDNASYGFARPGVTLLYPSFPDSLGPGWAYLLDTTTLTHGDHIVGIEVVDDGGTPTFIGERRFRVNNGSTP